MKGTRVNLFLDPRVLKQAKAIAVMRGLSFSRFVEDQLRDYIATLRDMKVEFVDDNGSRARK